MSRAPRPVDLFDLRVPTQVRISPDGSTVVFTLRSIAPARDGYRHTLWLVPSDGSKPAPQPALGGGGGRARRRPTRLPRDVSDLAWSADGARMCVVSAATSLVTKPERAPDAPPESDIRQIDRLMYMDKATGFTYDRPGRLWRVAAATGEAGPPP